MQFYGLLYEYQTCLRTPGLKVYMQTKVDLCSDEALAIHMCAIGAKDTEGGNMNCAIFCL